MSKTKKLSKVLALVLMLALVIGILPMGAMATGNYSSVTVNGLTMQFGDPDPAYPATSPEKDITLQVGANNTVSATYSGIANYHPDTLALYITAGENDIDFFSSGGGVTAQPTIKTFVGTDPQTGEPIYTFDETNDVTVGFYILTINTANSTGNNVTRYLEINKSDNTKVTLNFTIPPVVAPASNTGVMAYLPAGGQFTNEGVTTGGWGDAFTNAGALKALKNSYSSTGISLGAFGGYAVFDFGTPAKDASGAVTSGIYNDDTNAYGVDFIVYGNSFGTNAEPGCIQVGVDNSSGGITWYDIAGSCYYASDTVWDYQVVYTNPYMTDDALTPAANNLGQKGNGVPYSYSYTTIGGVTGSTVTGTGTVTYNPFHQHSWFPLNCNYFVARNSQSAALAKVSDLSFVDYTPYNASTSTAATVTLRGVKLGNYSVNSGYKVYADDFLFGYADCHAAGTASAAQVNPYTTGRTAGGDPIDISWAVNASGEPVNLPAIRYVRVYTGHQQMNGINGEFSTEVTGVYRATGSGSGSPTTNTNYIYIVGSTTGYVNNGGVQVSAGSFTVYSNATYIYVNGVPFTSGNSVSVSAGNPVQIITQTGTESPRVVVLYV